MLYFRNERILTNELTRTKLKSNILAMTMQFRSGVVMLYFSGNAVIKALYCARVPEAEEF